MLVRIRGIIDERQDARHVPVHGSSVRPVARTDHLEGELQSSRQFFRRVILLFPRLFKGHGRTDHFPPCGGASPKTNNGKGGR